MKVAFTGAHGTGKTTLVHALQDRLVGKGWRTAVTPEVPRIVCEASGDPTFFRREKNTLLRQLVLLAGQPIYEAAAEREGGLTLCDRAILDHWAYTRHLHGDNEDEAAARAADAFVQKHCGTYGLLFYVPIEFAPEDDGTREGDVGFQAAIDLEILRLLEAYSLSYITINGSVEERVAAVLSHLGPPPSAP